MITRTATARYEGMGKTGKGWITTQSGVLEESRYGFNTRFEGEPGTNPEELIAAAHAGCFTMALSFGLAKAGVSEGRLETEARVKLEQEGDGFTISRSDLRLRASVPGIEEAELRRLTEDAKAHCPVSKALLGNVEIEVDARLEVEVG